MKIQESPAQQDLQLSSGVRVVDTSGDNLLLPTPVAPVKVGRAEIEATIERLAQGPTPSNGRRSALLVHPESAGRGFSPGIEVSIEVLLPGERTVALRRNSSLVQISIKGTGIVEVADSTFRLAESDVCSVPSMKPHAYANDGDAPWVRLSYSNAPLLAHLGMHYFQEMGAGWKPAPDDRGQGETDSEKYTRQTAPDFAVSSTGSRLRGYEFLVDIEPVLNKPLHWPYREVSDLMSHEPGDGKRTIMALYNPAMGRSQGATPSFFVTLTQIPPGTKARPESPGHRHSSAAINYHFKGHGYSIVDGQTIEWEAGDLLLSAPSWREHAHYPSETGMSVYTIQDHPLHIGMESLIWQESMGGPILALGSEAGQTGYVAPRETGD